MPSQVLTMVHLLTLFYFIDAATICTQRIKLLSLNGGRHKTLYDSETAMTQNITLAHLQDSAYRFRKADASFPTGLRVVEGEWVTVQQTWQNYIQSLDRHTHMCTHAKIIYRSTD